jgi:hypothetical protein
LRKLLLKNENFKTIEDLKKELIKEYNSLDNLLKNKNINLSDKLKTTSNLVNFYKLDYQELKKDNDIYEKFKRI